MQRRATRAASGRGIVRIVMLVILVTLSGLAHHAGYAMEAGHDRHAVVADHCHGDGCLDHRDGQLGCCASGSCGAALPSPGSVAGLARVSEHLGMPAEIGPRWINLGLDRPPKFA